MLCIYLHTLECTICPPSYRKHLPTENHSCPLRPDLKFFFEGPTFERGSSPPLQGTPSRSCASPHFRHFPPCVAGDDVVGTRLPVNASVGDVTCYILRQRGGAQIFAAAMLEPNSAPPMEPGSAPPMEPGSAPLGPPGMDMSAFQMEGAADHSIGANKPMLVLCGQRVTQSTLKAGIAAAA